jgi:cytohesin
VREVPIEKSRANSFELFSAGSSEIIKACKVDSDGKVIEGRHNVYRMAASSVNEKDDWINCIRTSINDNPFYDMLAARRKNATGSNGRPR